METLILIALTYAEGRSEAARTGKPLVVFVGCKARSVAGAVSCEHHYFPDYPAQCIIVATPAMKWHATLPMTATDAQIFTSVTTAVGQKLQAVSRTNIRSSANC